MNHTLYEWSAPVEIVQPAYYIMGPEGMATDPVDRTSFRGYILMLEWTDPSKMTVEVETSRGPAQGAGFPAWQPWNWTWSAVAGTRTTKTGPASVWGIVEGQTEDQLARWVRLTLKGTSAGQTNLCGKAWGYPPQRKGPTYAKKSLWPGLTPQVAEAELWNIVVP